MDRLNKLRGDADASRDSTLETSTLGEAYLTANDSSKYFSLSEVDSSSTVSPSKEAVEDVTADTSVSHEERIISNLSPIPKKSELDSFKFGEQIEAANILSGGVNIFDDNENSYDGDELVIDDAVPEGDDKSAEVKLDENEDEKTDRLTDTGLEDTDAAVPSKETEVVLQIDGKNVDAIDIGNGLYLYRKDGEEELAAVQILDDNQQQPDIKFLKVRENAEGNLEVYEEIEIEVPKEMPTKEGKSVKKTSHIPVKDINKVSEPISNKVIEHKSQTVPKDTSTSEVELDMNKDNAHVESKTEVNLNGKMMKFSESRKSPLIGTYTPMTYHSTPNKEGIPLTKTMVDLQLHPNRHSENVKKTIEVHTDNCKQRLLETPTKSTKDSNEPNKCFELVSSSSDKDVANYIVAESADQSSQENNTNINQTLTGNHTNEIIDMKVNEDKHINDKYIDININDEKTGISEIKISNTALENTLDTPGASCKLNTKPFIEKANVKSSTAEMSGKADIEIPEIKSHDGVKDDLQTETTEVIHSECTTSENIKLNDGITASIDTTVKIQNNENITSDNCSIESRKKDTGNIIKENIYTSNTTMSNTDVIHPEKSGNNSNTTQNTVINPTDDRQKHCNILQNDSEMKDINTVKNSLRAIEALPDLELNQKVKNTDGLIKFVKLDSNEEIKESETLPTQILKSPTDDENIKTSVPSNLSTSKKDIEVDRHTEPFQEEPITSQKNLKPAVIKMDTLLPQAEPVINKLGNELKETGLKTVTDLKQQDNVCKTTSSKAEKIKSETQSKLFKYEDKYLNIDCSLSKKMKIADVNIEKKPVIDKKNELDKMSKGSIKKCDSKLNQLQNISSNVDTVATVPNVYNNKDLMTTDQNCSRKSTLITKANIVEKVEIQKKTEYNQMSTMIYPKDSLPSPDLNVKSPDVKVSHGSANALKEAEHSKNDVKKEPAKISKISIPKPINNNKAAVPFGKWTEANRQEFLNKIKESKVPINTSNTKQLKQPNDLNRRDILQKIDSQRQSNIASTKAPEMSILNKIKLKHETTSFGSKSDVTQTDNIKVTKVSAPNSKAEESVAVTSAEDSTVVNNKLNKEQPLPVVPVDMSSTALITKKDSVHRKEINNQDLIDKTIEGIINRAVTTKFSQEDGNQHNELVERRNNVSSYTPVSLDEIESKMNELHGIPFVERPPHELPKVMEHENKNVITSEVLTVSKCSKPPNVTSSSNKSHQKKEHKDNQPVITNANEDSDEEIIEHEPVTGDKEFNKTNVLVQGQVKDKLHSQELIATKVNCDSKKEPIITENDFDKFARRNSITYENCLTVNFNEKKPHNVVQTVVEKEMPKKLSRNEIMLAESKAKSHKQLGARHISYTSKIPTTTKTTSDEDSYNKSYQSKVQIAYQTVMTAKRQQECPITIIEDKPVKVVFMDGNHDYIPHQLNVQGKELSPPKKSVTEWDHFAHSNSESLDSDILDTANDSKSQDDVKFKSKHQRKQVLTPVEAPELELIEPGDLGIEVSPKKKRKIDDSKSEKNSKSLVPKKSYLLNRNVTTDDVPSNSQDSIPLKESVTQQDVFIKHTDPISAIDNLVKAAELLETQSENKHELPLTEQNSVAQQNSPAKRGRGRPRKYPLPEPSSDSKSSSPVKTPTPQKKPRLIDAMVPKHDTESEDDEINSDGELVKENWTMGKINENIVCPICNKLFRSENVVFKHVKHCTGPSPSRSDSDKRSPRRIRQSQESDWKSEESKSDSMDVDEDYVINKPTKKRKTKEKRSSTDGKVEDKTDIIVIDDTPIKDRDSPVRKRERLKNEYNKSMIKAKAQHGISNLVCEFCGKTFRQLSYLVNHRLQHKNTESKKNEKDHVHKSLFSCEICKKEFRKLHHLVQHRIIHNPNSMRSSRKSSSEQNDSKTAKDGARATEDQSAGFRCEPCDKSFRKLHHLVEHRETHDEINKKCNPVTTIDIIKPIPLHHCDICKRTFKKLQHLIEHKEQHLDTSSEKSDDKSVKSSLSTKDIIHECPLCYMVFPNEHSLNKHHIICQRKKKQSAAKQAKQIEDDNNPTNAIDDNTKITEERDGNLTIREQKSEVDASCLVIEDEILDDSEKQDSRLIEVAKPVTNQKEDATLDNDAKPTEKITPLKSESDRKAQVNEDNKTHPKLPNKKDGNECNADKISVKSKKGVIPTKTPIETIKIPDTPTPKKKLLAREKIGATVLKRQKTNDVSESGRLEDNEKPPDSSDDDEVRYMLNPDFQIEESNEGKLFMKVRAKKRNSLQIERPNSKDLMKRRISLQHPPKIPRLKVKPVPSKSINSKTVTKSSRTSVVPKEPPISTDSDDSDVKYSFPESIMKEIVKEEQKKVRKQKIVEKRKSLSNIAKRKSLGKIVSFKQKVKPSPAKQIKKRLADVEHRCDCGQLFSSAALLTRHTSLAHTPPRIRRRRSPPPESDAKSTSKRTEKPQQTRKTIETVPLKTGVTTRKSSINSELKAAETRKAPKTVSQAKLRRSTPHKGVPVPEKMRKLMDKSKK